MIALITYTVCFLGRSERSTIERAFCRNGLSVIEVEGTGSCFFLAVVRTMEGLGENCAYNSLSLRQAVVDFLIASKFTKYNANVPWTFIQYYEATKTEASTMSFEDYMESLRDCKTWADEMVVQATATLLNRSILCFLSNTADWATYSPLYDAVDQPPLCIANELNSHFVGSIPNCVETEVDKIPDLRANRSLGVKHFVLNNGLKKTDAVHRVDICKLSNTAYMVFMHNFNYYETKSSFFDGKPYLDVHGKNWSFPLRCRFLLYAVRMMSYRCIDGFVHSESLI